MPQTPQTAYMLGVIVFIVLLLISIVIANLIPYESGVNPRDPFKRKICFWVIALLVPVLVFAIGYLGVAIDIKSASKLGKFNDALYIATGLGFILYVVAGFALSKMFNRSKLGSWF